MRTFALIGTYIDNYGVDIPDYLTAHRFDKEIELILNSDRHFKLVNLDAPFDLIGTSNILYLFSAKARKVIEFYLTDIDGPLWHQLLVNFKEDDIPYYLLQFTKDRNFYPTPTDSEYIGVPKYIRSKIGDRHVFRPNTPFSRELFVSNEVADALIENQCTNFLFDFGLKII